MEFSSKEEELAYWREYYDDTPDVSEDELYLIRAYDSDGAELFDSHLLMVHTLDQAIEQFSIAYMAAHNGQYPDEVAAIELLTPVSGVARESIRLYKLEEL